MLYIDLANEGREKSRRTSVSFPPSARRMDTLNDLLAASDIISLHCALSDETMQILNAECLQHIKPGAFIVNTGNSQLIDDCALKQLLIDGTIAGCALDGAEGPQWMEAWVREMPNVLILPRSAEYSEEVRMEIREKALAILHSYFVDGVIPANIVSDDDEEKSDIGYEDSHLNLKVQMKGNNSMQLDNPLFSSNQKFGIQQTKDTQISSLTQNIQSRSEGRRSRSGRKGKKRPARVRSRQVSNDLSEVESSGNCASNKDDDNALSSRFTSPEDSRNKLVNSAFESTLESTPEKPNIIRQRSGHLLKDGDVIALHAKGSVGLLHVSRQRVTGGGWFLDTLTNVTIRDPAAQFIVDFRSKDALGLRSFASGGKLLQINRRMEFVFASHSFDVWENWMLEGSCLEQCRLVNCRNPLAVLDVCIELLATVSEDDGVARWLD